MRSWILLLALAGCRVDEDRAALARDLTGGDPARGRTLIRHYGCGSCHDIPGVRGASGRVGPPLGGVASRLYLAGRVPNTPDNLVLWITEPQHVEPGNVMPDMDIPVEDAQHIAAHLYTLR